MPARKRLNGAAAGILGAFVSRNNDIDGYWAVGVVYSEIDDLDLSEVTFRLLEGEVVPDLKCGSVLSGKYREAAIRVLKAHGVNPDEIVRADIVIRFGPLAHNRMFPERSVRDQPFS